MDAKAQARFWGKVDKTSDRYGCWLWAAHITNRGYGRICFYTGHKLARRVSFALANGREPVGVVRHTCDVPACVNPAHLVEGTQQDNVDDRERRKRGGGAAAANRAKTHCRRGHPFSGEHLEMVEGGKHRRCRTCENLNRRIRAARRKEA